MNSLFDNCTEGNPFLITSVSQYVIPEEKQKKLTYEDKRILHNEILQQTITKTPPKKPREYKPCERLLKQLKKDAKKGLYLK